MENSPLVSIIVRTKDRPKLLKSALQSIAQQTYRPLEVVLVNDGGCDLDIPDLRLILGDVALNYIRLKENRGRSYAGNEGIRNAKGAYIGLLDDDDQFYPGHVEALMDFLINSDTKVAYTDSVCVFQELKDDKYVTVGSKVLYSEDFDRGRLLVANYIPMLNVLFRRDLIDRAGLFDEGLEAHEDWDLWLRLSRQSAFHHISKITAEFSMRNDGTSITSSNRKAFLETARIIHKRYSSPSTDEDTVQSQNTVEWLLAKQVVANGEELGNRDLVDIAENVLQQREADIVRLQTVISGKDSQIADIEAVVTGKDSQIAELRAVSDGKDTRIAGLEVVAREKDRLEAVVAEKDTRIASLEVVAREKDRLEAVVAEKDTQIAGLEVVAREKDRLETVVAGKDTQIAGLESAVKEKDERIGNLETAVSERDATLNSIYSSHGWKALLFYYRVRDRIFHPDSRRRKAAKFLLNALRPGGNGRKKIMDASENRFARTLVSVYSSNSSLRRGFDAVNGFSHKYVRPVFPALHDKLFVDFKLYLKKRWLLGSGAAGEDPQDQLYSLPLPAQEKFYPRVSVIVPNFNHARYLRQRLDSVYGQTYKNFEVILLDDCSEDESMQILEEYSQRYPDITKCIFNKKNSGSVFSQWKLGLESASGEIIWIAESDDYCSENLLKELVPTFANEAVMLAFCRTVFVDGDTNSQSWTMEEYLADISDPGLWSRPFIRSAHHLANNMWGVKNIVPNVSSAAFRRPGRLELLEDEAWQHMRICGDWIFYLHMIRGGLVAYTPAPTNFYRMHKRNTSVNTYKQDIYYREHEKVAEELVKLYRLQDDVLERLRRVLEGHWRIHREDYSESDFLKCYDSGRIRQLSGKRRPNLMIVAFALASGGGETFAVRLSNMLKAKGNSVTLLNFHRLPTQKGVRRMLREDIPLLELDRWDKLSAVVNDMGIEIVHSHHAWVDVTVCSLLEDNPNCGVIVTTHGMYEMMPQAEINRVNSLLKKRVDRFVYLADKNLGGFDFSIVERDRFVKIGNAMEELPIAPVPREALGIGKEAFVLCTVSRAMPEKGWKEGIAAVTLARELSGKEIHLLLIGDGPEYDRLKTRARPPFIHFMGFRENVRDYFAASDLGFLPSRFRGESYPLVVIECLHANRPMLASDIGEIANMLGTGTGPAGSVFALDDWKLPVRRIAEIIAEYATNKDLYEEHLKRVPEAVKKFNTEDMVRSYEAVYREVIAATGK